MPAGSDYVTIPKGGLAVTLTGDNTVGFGSTATGTITDVFFGLIKSYSGANTVGVQFTGFAVDVPTKGAIPIKSTNLIVTNDGALNTIADATGTCGIVTKASTVNNLTATIKMI